MTITDFTEVAYHLVSIATVLIGVGYYFGQRDRHHKDKKD